MKEITVHAPATVANLVCGFDVLGLCLAEPYDIMHVRLLDKRQVIIKTTDGFPLPSDPALNTAGAPLLEMLAVLKQDVGFEVNITKQIKPGSGIGSSAASAAGAVVAANELLGKVFSNEELVRFAMFGEKVASGVKHADNIAPCIYGRYLIGHISSRYHSHPAPSLFVSVLHPIEVRTSDAGNEKEVLLKDAIRQWGISRTGGWINEERLCKQWTFHGRCNYRTSAFHPYSRF